VQMGQRALSSQCFCPIMKTKIAVGRELQRITRHQPSVEDRARSTGM
jgi:hypothetical protein